MKVSTFSGFLQEKFEFFFNGRKISEKGAEIVAIFDSLPLYRFIGLAANTGRPPHSRLCILKSFLMKSALNIMENKKLREILLGSDELRKLCGWDEVQDVPSESTFSRVFRDFAQMNVAQHIHEYLMKTVFNDKIIMHISRDATAVPAREKSKKKVKKKKVKGKGKRGRPPKGTPPKQKEQSRLKKQLSQNLDEAVSELPSQCDWGCKTNSQGNPGYWRGYKLHADFSDEGIPLSFILTSASTHDSQVAIPLILMSSNRALYFYELMDAGYDMDEIKTVSKDNYGVEKSRFKTHAKILSHIGFSMVVLTMRKIFQFGYKLETGKQEKAA